jgi:ATP-dependent RNA helicase DDX49/DBP8
LISFTKKLTRKRRRESTPPIVPIPSLTFDETHIMAAPNAHASIPTINQDELPDEAADSSFQPAHAEDSSSDSSGSDSLDSNASRKRRKTSLTDDPPPIHITSAPSRIKSKTKNDATNNQASNGAILAPIDPQTSFASLGVKPWLVGALGAMAIKRPTGIQKGCIPEILKGRDCIGGSRTGSGKTVAFAVPILQKWAEDPFGIFALVLTPTRYVCCDTNKSDIS